MPLYRKNFKLSVDPTNTKFTTTASCCCCCGEMVCSCSGCTFPSSVSVDLSSLSAWKYAEDTLPCPGTTYITTQALPNAVTLNYCSGQCANPSYPYLDPPTPMYLGMKKIGTQTRRTFKCSVYCMDPGTYGYCLDQYYYDWGTDWVQLVTVDLYIWVVLRSQCVPAYGASPRVCGTGAWTLEWGVIQQGGACCSCSDDPITKTTPRIATCAEWIGGSCPVVDTFDLSTCTASIVCASGAEYQSGGNITYPGPNNLTLEVTNNLRGVDCVENRRRTNPCDPTGTYKNKLVAPGNWSVSVS